MSDEIDRSIEPQFGAENDSAKKLAPGVRVKSRKVKSVDIEEGKNPVAKKAKKAKVSKRKEPKKNLKTKPTLPNQTSSQIGKV